MKIIPARRKSGNMVTDSRKMAIDQEAIQFHIRGILEALGENPDREGLQETPARVARMYAEVFEGMNYTNAEIARMFGKTFENYVCTEAQSPSRTMGRHSGQADIDDGQTEGDIVLVKDIDVFSYCEHHMALMYDMKVSVAYIPNGKVIGLSKIARIAEMAAKRLQLQERIGADIAEIMQLATGTEDVAVLICGCHSCMTARGINKPGAKTVTQTLRGRFLKDTDLQNRLMMMCR